ncbi:MAG TPA: tRNA (adenosine(37)-N6)-threonylcarbamoyltransferase complex dimerization subunit type 1 TsaB [Patescibacteria group bacterium]|nr:tRNA (adenosine(37)-N6)-threonylcarbamoyltransferase complex dimerization subunit type 1 TsaB [Patescibacteria group bacterium]
MNVLAFDCCTQACSAAVLADGRVLAHRAQAMGRGQAEVLMPMIQAVLAEAGLSWAEIGLVAVTVGPGTFTGLRIGLAAARGMAVAAGLPVAGVTTTETVAYAVPEAERRGRTLLVAIDGKRADIFVQAFAEDLTPLGEAAALMPDDIVQRYPGPLVLAGDAAHRLAELRPDALVSCAEITPNAVVLAGLAARRYCEGRSLSPAPLYLRPPDVTLPGPPR